MQTTRPQQELVSLALNGIAVAMGVAVVVLQILGTVPLASQITLLGIGLFALAVGMLRRG